MPTPEQTQRVAAVLLVSAAVAFAALAAWSLAARSAIPLTFDGRVTSVETRTEKHPGVDDVWLVSIDGHQRQLDAELATTLEVGDRVAKDRWDSRLEVNGRHVSLQLSDDARAMSLLAPAVSLLVALLAVPGRRRWTTRNRLDRA